MLAKEVMVLVRVECVLDQFAFSRGNAKPALCCDRRPEPGSAADRAVAPIGALSQIKIGLEFQRAAMATSGVCLFHFTNLPIAV